MSKKNTKDYSFPGAVKFPLLALLVKNHFSLLSNHKHGWLYICLVEAMAAINPRPTCLFMNKAMYKKLAKEVGAMQQGSTVRHNFYEGAEFPAIYFHMDSNRVYVIQDDNVGDKIFYICDKNEPV